MRFLQRRAGGGWETKVQFGVAFARRSAVRHFDENSVYRALAITSRKLRDFTSVWRKRYTGNLKCKQMAQQLRSDYFFKLDSKLKARDTEKTALIRKEDPYALKRNDFCSDTCQLPALT